MFDKSEITFPTKETIVFMAHCSISPLYTRAAAAMKKFVDDMAAGGIAELPKYFYLISKLHQNVAQFLRTSPDNISYVHNTAEALCIIANGYPFQQGDEVISYIHEYPSNHYPWVLQEKRGVKLVLLSDSISVDGLDNIGKTDKPTGWSMSELEEKVTNRTRVVAVSHAQYSSGFAINLKELGGFCKERNIDLVVDCAQSLGCLPVYPEEYHVSAIAASAWKWLMGPMGSGLLYTSEEFRSKLEITMTGPDQMQQGLDYVDLQWNPRCDGKIFEYSTLPWDHIAAMNVVFEEIFLSYTIEDIQREIFRLHDLLLNRLDQLNMQVLLFPKDNRSGILAAEPVGDYRKIMKALLRENIVISAPIGYLRFAPHYYNDDNQIESAAKKINEILAI